MKKLVKGIIEFQKNMRPSYREAFVKLALGQSPDTLFITCSDSRVAINVFASTDPGDLFVIRNVGNLVPPCGGHDGLSVADESEAAAIEFAVVNLGVSDIVICGHSECGAMHALLEGREKVKTPNLKAWLRHGEAALTKMNQSAAIINAGPQSPPASPRHNRLSQLNILLQVENLKSYPIIAKKIAAKTLRVHAFYFELARAMVFRYDPAVENFVEFDEKQAQEIVETSL